MRDSLLPQFILLSVHIRYRMHARVVSFEVRPGKNDEVLEVAQGPALEAMKQRREFKGWLLPTDRDDNRVLSMPQWETEADMMASDAGSDYLRQQTARVASLIVDSSIEHYEVSVRV
jgi:heme-degrading monooxygenase HmoA